MTVFSEHVGALNCEERLDRSRCSAELFWVRSQLGGLSGGVPLICQWQRRAFTKFSHPHKDMDTGERGLALGSGE